MIEFLVDRKRTTLAILVVLIFAGIIGRINIPIESESIHGISTELAVNKGVALQEVLDSFIEVLGRSEFIVGQNLMLDGGAFNSTF